MEHRRDDKSRNMRSDPPTDVQKHVPNVETGKFALATDGELFRACFAHAPIGFAVTDVEGRILEANPAYCAITGYSETELRSMNFAQLEHPDDLLRTTANLRALLAGECSDFVIEKRYLRKNGEAVWVQNSISLVRDQVGRSAYVVRLTQDISEQVRLQRAHQESESKFRLFMSNLPNYAWIKSSDGRYLFMNNRLEDALPVHKNDWAGRTDEDFWPSQLASEYRKSDRTVLENKRQLQTIESWEYQGERKLFLVNKFPIFDERGEVVMIGGVSLDVTDHKRIERSLLEAEQKYRDIFKNVGEGIFQSTPDGRYIAANPALARMYGFDSPEELIASCNDISRQIYVDPARREEFKLLMESDGVVREFETEVHRKDGSKCWISVNARAVRDGDETISYYEGTTQDITDRKRAEARSAAFASLARKLSGARTCFDAAWIIGQTAKDLFGWDACNLDLYEADSDQVFPLLNVDTIDGQQVDVTRLISSGRPTARGRRVIENGPQLILREEPVRFDRDAEPFGDKNRPSASLMSVPIRHGATIVGLLSIHSYTPHAYDQPALNDLVALADHCGAAINRIHAEELLHESEERFRQLADNMQDVVWMTDQNIDRILYINPAYETIFGRSSASLYERLTSFLDAVHPDDQENVEHLLERQRHGDHQSFEYRIVRPDGTVRWIHRRTFPIRNDDGEVYRVAGIGQDITERKQSEQALRESEERYRDLVENSHELICTHALDGTILSANRAAVELFGYAPNEFVGKKNIRDVLAPEVRDQFGKYIDRILKERATNGLMLIQTSSGEHRVFEYYNSLRTEGVEAPIVRGIARDITERRRAEKALRESEERYRELFENSKDAIYVHTMGGMYTSVNRAAEELSGYTREEIIGRYFWDFIAPEYVKQVRHYLCEKLDEVGETTYEIEIITKDGRRVPVEVSSRLIYEEGTPIAIQGTARDISERQRAQEVLQSFSRQLIKAQETERQNIARELHDEIGQVLTAVKINLHTVKNSCTTAECLPRIEESVAVVDEALSRVRELSLSLRPALLDDLGLAAALRWYIEHFAQRTSIDVELVSEIGKGRVSRDVETACFRIAQEALTNVARHARATKCTVRLKRSHNGLFLTIADNGIGFDTRRYERTSSALGLRGMTERAEAAKGTLAIYSKSGKGTRVVASFLLRKSQGSAVPFVVTV